MATAPTTATHATADPSAQRIGELVTVLFMGLVVRQGSLGLAAELNNILKTLASTYAETRGFFEWVTAVPPSNWGVLLLLTLLVALGVDLLIWVTPLNKCFSVPNILWVIFSAALTLLLVHIVADPGFVVETGIYPVALLGMAIPAVHWWNFGRQMPWLDGTLRMLKLVINPIIGFLGLLLLIIWVFSPSAGLFLLMVAIAFGALTVYMVVGWSRLLKLGDITCSPIAASAIAPQAAKLKEDAGPRS